LQFRYLFIVDGSGLRVADVTVPEKARLIPGAEVLFKEPYKIYVARTYAYVAAGRQGLAIVDIENPERPKLYSLFDAGGAISDARDVVVGSTNASLFAYVADGKNGLKVVQLTAPDTQPKFYGFSPEPKPQLVAWKATRSAALALSRGLERDRAADETGHQIAVLGRLGARPMNSGEMSHLYLDENGAPWFVDDEVEGGTGIATKPVPWRPNRIWSADNPSATGDPVIGSTQRPRAVPASAAGGSH